MVLVEEFNNAHLECLVDSNPVNERVVSWLRRKDETETVPLTSSSSSSSSNSGSFDDDESFYSRMRSDIEILSDDAQQFSNGPKIKSSLLVMNATLEDSGTSFDCIANNGIGKESKSTITLLVLREYPYSSSSSSSFFFSPLLFSFWHK